MHETSRQRAERLAYHDAEVKHPRLARLLQALRQYGRIYCCQADALTIREALPGLVEIVAPPADTDDGRWQARRIEYALPGVE